MGIFDAARNGIQPEQLGGEAGVGAEEGRGDELAEERHVAEGGAELEAGF